MQLEVKWLPVFAVIVVYVVRLRELRTKRNTVPGSIPETLTLRLFMLVGTLTLLGSTLEYWWQGAVFKLWPWVAGCLCAIASFVIRRRAIAALGRFWSLHVEIRETHQFVQSGPFRWMRHPTYFSMILELLSCALMLGVYVPLLIGGLIFVPTLWVRIKLEETALVGKFGDAYQKYRQTTPALFPYKIPHSQ